MNIEAHPDELISMRFSEWLKLNDIEKAWSNPDALQRRLAEVWFANPTTGAAERVLQAIDLSVAVSSKSTRLKDAAAKQRDSTYHDEKGNPIDFDPHAGCHAGDW